MVSVVRLLWGLDSEHTHTHTHTLNNHRIMRQTYSQISDQKGDFICAAVKLFSTIVIQSNENIFCGRRLRKVQPLITATEREGEKFTMKESIVYCSAHSRANQMLSNYKCINLMEIKMLNEQKPQK